MALVTLSKVKQYGDQDTITNPERDDLLTTLINRVTTQFETYCGRTFESAETTEYLDGGGIKFLFPAQYPITSVSGIWSNSSWDWDDDDLISSDDYRIKNSNYIVLKSSTFSNYDQNIKITYTHGYTADDIPEDLQQACIEETLRKWKSRNKIDVLSVSLEDGSITHLTKDLLPQTIMTLNRYKKRSIY